MCIKFREVVAFSKFTGTFQTFDFYRIVPRMVDLKIRQF